jgi:hypothetical protein
MTLVDRTNEEIALEMEDTTLYVDVDQDSSVWPDQWVWLAFEDHEYEHALRLTLDEAGLLHDRLGLILGRQS